MIIFNITLSLNCLNSSIKPKFDLPELSPWKNVFSF